MSEEKNEKLHVHKSNVSIRETPDQRPQENEQNKTSGPDQNLLLATVQSQERESTLNSCQNDLDPSAYSAPIIPSLSKWVASNVQSISKFLNSETHSSSSNRQSGNAILVMGSTELKFENSDSSENPKVLTATRGTLPRPATTDEIIASTSPRSGNISQINRPSSSRPNTSTGNHTQSEILISSQELSPFMTSNFQENLQPPTAVSSEIQEILNQTITLSTQYDRGGVTSLINLQQRTSNEEFIVRGQAIPFDSESRLEVIISPPPCPPRIIHGPPSITGAPPSYSAVMRVGTEPYWGRRVGIRPSPPFIAPPPPPAYTQIVGYAPCDMSDASAGFEDPESYSDWIRYALDQMVWGPEPITIVCPRCANVIVTAIHTRRSGLSHLSAIAMFIFGCWPCCLLPYCMDSCKNTYHYCPRCQAFLGVYRPW